MTLGAIRPTLKIAHCQGPAKGVDMNTAQLYTIATRQEVCILLLPFESATSSIFSATLADNKQCVSRARRPDRQQTNQEMVQTYLVSSAKRSEIHDSLWQGIAIQAKHNLAHWNTFYSHLKESVMSDCGISRWCLLRLQRRWPAVIAHNFLFECYMDHAALVCLLKSPIAA